MMRLLAKNRFLTGVVAALTAGSARTENASGPSGYGKPNVVVILADDIGYGDFSCYGARKIQTPNVDRLAAQGRLFTDGYSATASCTPTRYSLLTGEYAWRNKDVRVSPADAPMLIAPGRLTLPGLMKRAGYATGLIGKWHLGLGTKERKVDFNRVINPGPLEIGFDTAWYFPAAGGWVPCIWVENHNVVGLDERDPIVVDSSVPRGAPESYLNGLPHIGMQKGGTAATFKYDQIPDVLVEKSIRFIETHKDKPFFLYLATHDVHVPRIPPERFRGTSQAGARGDAVVCFDWTVGQVVDALKRLGLFENTLIIISSDNGGSLSEGVDSNRGHSYNGPLRGHKGQSFEGGVRVPFIASWPDRMKPGVCEEIVSLMDLMGAMAALTGQTLPDDAAVDSFNILPELLGEVVAPARDHLVLEGMPAGHGDRPALRLRNWKLIPAEADAEYRNGEWFFAGRPWTQLYNLNDGLYEDNNLAAREPERLKAMSDRLQQILNSERTRLLMGE
jgi:arylsulfatase A-like enzyme